MLLPVKRKQKRTGSWEELPQADFSRVKSTTSLVPNLHFADKNVEIMFTEWATDAVRTDSSIVYFMYWSIDVIMILNDMINIAGPQSVRAIRFSLFALSIVLKLMMFIFHRSGNKFALKIFCLQSTIAAFSMLTRVYAIAGLSIEEECDKVDSRISSLYCASDGFLPNLGDSFFLLLLVFILEVATSAIRRYRETFLCVVWLVFIYLVSLLVLKSAVEVPLYLGDIACLTGFLVNCISSSYQSEKQSRNLLANMISLNIQVNREDKLRESFDRHLHQENKLLETTRTLLDEKEELLKRVQDAENKDDGILLESPLIASINELKRIMEESNNESVKKAISSVIGIL